MISLYGGTGFVGGNFRKMYDGCLYVIDDNRYVAFLNRYNDGTLL